VVISGVGTAF